MFSFDFKLQFLIKFPSEIIIFILLQLKKGLLWPKKEWKVWKEVNLLKTIIRKLTWKRFNIKICCKFLKILKNFAFWTTLQLSFKISRNRTRIANTTVHIVFGLSCCRVPALCSFVNNNPPFPIAIIEFFVPSHPPCGDGYSTSFVKQRRCYYTHYYLAPSAHRAIRLYLLSWVNYNIKQRTYYARGLYHRCIICPSCRVCYQKTGFYCLLDDPSAVFQNK